jgi:hypothetical protein
VAVVPRRNGENGGVQPSGSSGRVAGMECSISGCGKPDKSQGLCSMHYERRRRHGHTDDPVRPERAPCSVPGCDKLRRRNGLCPMHASRQRLHGDPLTVLRIQGDDLERFARSVRRDESGCWLWTGVRHPTRGYGRFHVGGRAGVNGKYVQAHRWSYEYHVAPIPTGLHIDHLCNQRECVNPDHLEPVTQAENNRRSIVRRLTRNS